MILTKKSVYRHLIRPLEKLGYDIELVGSIAGIFERSYKDIDILLNLPKYPLSEQLFNHFETDLKKLKWEYNFTDEHEDYGIFHNYQKRGIGLDIFIYEAVK